MKPVYDFLTERQFGQPRLIAHRGSSEQFPENTIPAFDKAVEEGAQMLEFDVLLTSDAIPVVIHDPNLKRLSGIRKRVSALTCEELLALDVGSHKKRVFRGVGVPLLRQVLERYKDYYFNIELKKEAREVDRARLVEQVIEQVESLSLSHQVLYSSFDYEFMKEVKSLHSGARTALLINGKNAWWRRNPQKILQEYQADFIHCSIKQFTPKFAQKLSECGIPVNVYTVNKVEEYERCAKLGAFGVFTDRPGELKAELGINHA